jgi:hypothetical protein
MVRLAVGHGWKWVAGDQYDAQVSVAGHLLPLGMHCLQAQRGKGLVPTYGHLCNIGKSRKTFELSLLQQTLNIKSQS